MKKIILLGGLLSFVAVFIAGISIYHRHESRRIKFTKPFVEVLFDSTNLPIVMINTNGNARRLSKSDAIKVGVTIIDKGKGGINYADTLMHLGQHVDYEGFAEMRFRGHSSLIRSAKKSYSINLITENGEGKDKARLLGMKKSSKWCLRAVHSDGTLMRDVLTNELARNYFSYVPSDRYCELVVDDVYHGVYLLSERVTKDRLKLKKSDSDDDQLSGGYLIEKDRGNDFRSNYPPRDSKGNNIGTRGVAFQIVYPKPKNRTDEQMDFIKRELAEAENAIESANYEQYSKCIDVEEFVNYLLVEEIAYNADAYRMSLKVYKSPQTDGLFKLALWDCDYTYGNYSDSNYVRYDMWQYQLPYAYSDTLQYPVFWWNQLMKDSVFANKVKEQYLLMREHEYSEQNITAVIDSLQNMLTRGQAIDRNTLAWNTYEDYRKYSRKGESFKEEVDFLRHWIDCRLNFMDVILLGKPLSNNGVQN